MRVKRTAADWGWGIGLALVFVMTLIGIGATVGTVASAVASHEASADPTDAMDGSHDYAEFLDNADAGFMQLVTLPIYRGMNGPTDAEGYMVVNTFSPKLGYDTFAVYKRGFDLRTNTGCFELWRSDYGEPFCVSDADMQELFQHGAYFLAYRTY